MQSRLALAIPETYGDLLMSSKSELSTDQLTKAVLDLCMTRNWRFPSVPGIDIYVVTLAMTLKVAAQSDQLSNEVPPFHTSTPISFV